MKVSIQINAQLADLESIAFAYALYSVLGDLGMDVGKLGQTNKLFQFGVQLSGPPGDDLERFRTAFTEIGIKLDVTSGEKYILSVGSKLPEVLVPQFQKSP